MAIAQNHVINIQPGVSAPLVIHCSQGDTGTVINLTVVNGDEEFDCSSYACSVHGTRSDRANWGPVTCNVSGSTVIFSLTSEMTAVAGSCLAEVSIGTVGTANFALLVENATFENGVTYSNDVSVYQNILAAVQDGISNEATERVTAVTTEKNERVAAVEHEKNERVTAVTTEKNERVAAVEHEKNERVAAVEHEKNERVAADNSLSNRISQNDARINNLVGNTGDSNSEIVDGRVGATVLGNKQYSNIGNAIRGQAIDLFNYQQSVSGELVEEQLYPTTHYRYYWYNNGNLYSGNFDQSAFVSVKGVYDVTFTVTTSQYYDVYDFVDDNFNSIEHLRMEDLSGTNTLTRIVPVNAAFIVFSGFSNLTVKGRRPYNGKTWKSLNPVNKLLGYVKWESFFNKDPGYRTYVYDVDGIDNLRITFTSFMYMNPVTFFDGAIDDIASDNGYFNQPYPYNVEHTVNVNNSHKFLAISSNLSAVPSVYGFISDSVKELKNSTKNSIDVTPITWFGTSIPAGKPDSNYPTMIGDILDIKVFNEAVGSSSVTCRNPERISENNPYGFTHDFELCSRCLTNTVEQMQWVIDHYNDTSVFDYRTVSEMTDALKQSILSNSYENKLNKYFANNWYPSMFVFDHGHNDITTIYHTEKYYDYNVKLSGTKQTTWYSGGNTVASKVNQCVIFDVHEYAFVYLNGTIGPYYDMYDLLDENKNVISHLKNGYANDVLENYLLSTNGAHYLAMNSLNTELDGLSCAGLPYGDPDKNVYSFRGAMGFLFNLIYTQNPRSRIIMIGDYNKNKGNSLVAEMQEWVAKHWNLPLYKPWENYGWTDHVISTGWYWDSDGVLKSGGTVHEQKLSDYWLKDGVHPHSAGETLPNKFIANNIAAWLKNNIRIQEQ